MRVRAAAVAVAGGALAVLAVLVLLHATDAIDGPVGTWTWSHRADDRPGLLRLVSLASPTHLLLAVTGLAVAGSVLRRTPRPAVVAVLVCGAATMAELALKWGMPRLELRLDGTGAAGFPSGHVVAAVAYTGALVLALRTAAQWWQWLPVAAAGGLASAAVLLTSLHTPTEVLGAWALACAVLAGASAVGEICRRHGLATGSHA